MSNLVYRSIIFFLVIGIIIVTSIVGHDMGYVDFDVLEFFKGILNYE